MAHPRRLIPPPSGGSSGCFTSPARGSAETASRLDSEYQEDREGPQLTSSDGGRRATLRPPAITFPPWIRSWRPYGAAAAADQATLGLLLMGSRAIGSPLPDSDYEVLWVLTDEGMEARAARGEPREAKEGNVDVSY